jgi:hypothetical protein
MPPTLETILYYLVFLDSLFAVFLAWSGRGEDLNIKFGVFTRFFPITRGWTLYYLILVLWIGYALSRLQII